MSWITLGVILRRAIDSFGNRTEFKKEPSDESKKEKKTSLQPNFRPDEDKGSAAL